MRVFRVGNESALAISDAVQRYVAETRDLLPAGVSLTTWDDDARVLRGRIDTLTRNARSGLLLVLLSLTLFLKPRLAFWVAFGLPISFLGMFIPRLGMSIPRLGIFIPRSFRNAMYIGGLMVFFGFGMMERSISIMTLAVIVAGAFHLFVVFVEEPELERRFGNSYLEYKNSTNRWIPSRAGD